MLGVGSYQNLVSTFTLLQKKGEFHVDLLIVPL
jgi:hypothetical protein